MKNAWGTPAYTPTTSLRRVVTVKKPDITPHKNSTKMAKLIRDYILRDEFGYTETDVQAFNLAHPTDLVIEDTSKPNVWATDFQVKSWKSKPVDLVEIVLEEPWVKAVENFRENRADFEIFKALMFITDASLREKLSVDLQRLISSSGEIRIKAFDNLMVAIAGSGTSLPQIDRALRSLINSSGYKDNPFLLLCLARTTAYKSTAPSFSSIQVDSSKIIRSIGAANRWLYAPKTKSPLSKLTKREAASINGWASEMLREINVPELANDRRWIRRFLSMPDEERDQYKDGDLIPIVPPGQNVVRQSTNAEKDFENLNREWNETNRRWEQIDRIGNPAPVTDQRTSEYLQRPTDTYEKEEWKFNKQRAGRKKPKPKVEPTLKPVNPSPYQRANTTANAYGGLLGLYVEAGKWVKFSLRMQAVTRYLNEKARIERQIVNERVRLKPPRPEVTLQHIEEFRRYGRITANSFERRRIIVTLNQLYILLEEGRAYYK